MAVTPFQIELPSSHRNSRARFWWEKQTLSSRKFVLHRVGTNMPHGQRDTGDRLWCWGFLIYSHCLSWGVCVCVCVCVCV